MVSDIVSESEGCRAAATQLGMNYNGLGSSFQVPEGCYYVSSDNSVSFNSHTKTDNVDIMEWYGGVCKRGISAIFCAYCTYTK